MKTQKYPNLTPWQPGQSGNPAGRKSGSKNMSTLVKELLDEDADRDLLAQSSIAALVQDASLTYGKAVVLATIQKALQGNMQAISWLAEQQEKVSSVQIVQTQEPIIISNIEPRFNLQ